MESDPISAATPSHATPSQLLGDLCQLVSQRAPAEERIAAEYQTRSEAADEAHQTAIEGLTRTHQADRAALEGEYQTLGRETLARLNAAQSELKREHDAALARIQTTFEDEKSTAEQAMMESHWEATAVAEAAKGGAGTHVKEIHGQLEARWKELHSIHQRAVELLEHWGQWRDFPEPQPSGSLLERHPMQRFTHALDLAREQFAVLASEVAPRFFIGLRPMGIFLAMWALTIYPAIAILGADDWRWAAVSGGGSFLVFAIAGGWLYSLARRRTGTAYSALRRIMVEAGVTRATTLETAKAECERLFAVIDNRQRTDMKRANDKFALVMTEIQARKNSQMQKVEADFGPRLLEKAMQREATLHQLDEIYPQRLRAMDDAFEAETRRLDEAHEQEMAESRQLHDRQWQEMADGWLRGTEQFQTRLARISAECDHAQPDWHTADWDRWHPPTEMPAVVRFGSAPVRLTDLEAGLPRDPRLKPTQTEFLWPAVIPFPRQSLLMLKATGEGRARAVEGLQTAMLRLLTALPPGKVRFTILDPVGLGENFSAFMHLADYDEQLVASRIWTDTSHIEQRLADLTQHMENVIQVYLRNEFQTIEQYNQSAGEMAEPYRVLVIANFPANFSESAALRLKSIAASGARCGVFVLMSVDGKLPQPRGFHLSDLEANAMVLQWSGDRFVWQHPTFGPLSLELDRPPAADRFTDLVRAVGQRVKEAGRVEVPFSCVIPEEAQWWTGDSRGGIEVPLGRAGAMKLQHLELGKGTSQHVLVSGKTGSGKSTLLHVLITNLALRYSPDEVELYLVDFKKGVEFKAYARYGLPHARVIAIESEREFGVSVLQRLDAELRTRGDLFRRLGVQDLKGFRNHGDAATEPVESLPKLPRILLIVDEFQELFVEDDRIAQEAALLMDRLVRQGRAFGIHVFLGSQTLGGAYSLARSTIGQMAVRIALQCSESDAHLILSEENTAARLLTRPGEAIYNDANGLFEGNHPFQIVWLPDDQRDAYLERVTETARARHYPTTPPIVFEGNVLADASENHPLSEALAARAWSDASPAPSAWLGSAVAIKDPTAAKFVRQAGSNLLLVGHREEASLGVMATALVSLAAQLPPGGSNGEPAGARFFILDGTRPEAPEAGYWHQIVPALPHSIEIVDPLGLPATIGLVADELARRQEQPGGPPIYLFIYNIGRFRDLRKEDDYSFGGMDDGKPASPAKQFGTILREGPALGIHTLAWCDSFSTLNRLLDRQALRDFEMRVLFQMSATDSSSLTDSPEASRLGVHRAIFYDEGEGHIEKFRPYAAPAADWLATVRQQLFARTAGEQ